MFCLSNLWILNTWKAGKVHSAWTMLSHVSASPGSVKVHSRSHVVSMEQKYASQNPLFLCRESAHMKDS